MGTTKKVNITRNDINSGKVVKQSKNPESYKDQNICWQFGLMDFEFDHGWDKVINRLEFDQLTKQSLTLALMEMGCGDDIFNTVDNINISSFIDHHGFFSKLSNIESISSNELLCILKELKKNFFWNTLYPKFKDIESKKWKELEMEQFGKKGKSKNHWVEVQKIIKPAQDRLKELKLDDIDSLYSIRITATQRIWGIRVQNYFQLLWYDFEHLVCPSQKK